MAASEGVGGVDGGVTVAAEIGGVCAAEDGGRERAARIAPRRPRGGTVGSLLRHCFELGGWRREGVVDNCGEDLMVPRGVKLAVESGGFILWPALGGGGASWMGWVSGNRLL